MKIEEEKLRIYFLHSKLKQVEKALKEKDFEKAINILKQCLVLIEQTILSKVMEHLDKEEWLKKHKYLYRTFIRKHQKFRRKFGY